MKNIVKRFVDNKNFLKYATKQEVLNDLGFSSTDEFMLALENLVSKDLTKGLSESELGLLTKLTSHYEQYSLNSMETKIAVATSKASKKAVEEYISRQEEEKVKLEEEQEEAKRRELAELRNVLVSNDFGYIPIESYYKDYLANIDVKDIKLDGNPVSIMVNKVDYQSIESKPTDTLPFSFEYFLLHKDNSIRTVGFSKSDRSYMATLFYNQINYDGLLDILIFRPDFQANFFQKLFYARNGKINLKLASTGFIWLESALKDTIDDYLSGSSNSFSSYILDSSKNPASLLQNKDIFNLYKVFMYTVLAENNLISADVEFSKVIDLDAIISTTPVDMVLDNPNVIKLELKKTQIDNLVNTLTLPKIVDDITVMTLADVFMKCGSHIRNDLLALHQLSTCYSVVRPLIRALVLNDYSAYDMVEANTIKENVNLKHLSNVYQFAADALRNTELRPTVPSERWYANIDMIHSLVFNSDSAFIRLVGKTEFVRFFKINYTRDLHNDKKLCVIEANYNEPRDIKLNLFHTYGDRINLSEFNELDQLTSASTQVVKDLYKTVSYEFINDIFYSFTSPSDQEYVISLNASDEQLKMLRLCLSDKLYVSKQSKEIFSFIASDHFSDINKLRNIQNGVFSTSNIDTIFVLSKGHSGSECFPLKRLPSLSKERFFKKENVQPYFKKGMFKKQEFTTYYVNNSRSNVAKQVTTFNMGELMLSHLPNRELYMLVDDSLRNSLKLALALWSKLKNHYNTNISKDSNDKTFSNYVDKVLGEKLIKVLLSVTSSTLGESITMYNGHIAFDSLNARYLELKKKAEENSITEKERLELEYLPNALSIQDSEINKILVKVSNSLLILDIFGIVDTDDKSAIMAYILNYFKTNYSPDSIKMFK